MKKISIFVALILCMILCMAAASPTVKQEFKCIPSVPFTMIESQEELQKALEYADVDDLLLEAIIVELDQKYEKVTWELLTEVKKDDYFYAIITNGEVTVMQELENKPDHSVISDFSNFELGTYYMLFYKVVE